MIQDKKLLLKDLCARLPYRLKVKCDPDASYQDDVCAFIWALEELMKNIKVV